MQTTDCRLHTYFSYLFLVMAFWVLLYEVLLGCKDCASYLCAIEGLHISNVFKYVLHQISIMTATIMVGK